MSMIARTPLEAADLSRAVRSPSQDQSAYDPDGGRNEAATSSGEVKLDVF